MTEKTRTTEEIMDEMERNYFETEKFEVIGMGDDYHFQVLAFIGEATHKLVVANTIAIDSLNNIPQELKYELSSLVNQCDKLKIKIREARDE